MPKFFKLATLLIGLSALLLAVAANTYTYTKRSYKEVGFNNGKIHANFELMKKIKEAAHPLNQCGEFARGGDKVKLIEVKAEVIYLIGHPDGGYMFCE